MKTRNIVFCAIVIALVCCMACVAVACDDKTATYTVTFSGESVSVPAQTVKDGGLATEPQVPTRDGYAFDGWFEEGSATAFDFSTPIKKDITLVAKWEKTNESEIGTKNNPYLISTADDLLDFADRVNNPETEEDVKYLSACFKLVADIDMSGQKYIAAGQIVTFNEGEENEKTINGFSGIFDGNGHKISNLTISKAIKKNMSYVGLFGYCERATIKDLTLENVNYKVETYKDDSSVGVYIGGVVGFGSLTNISNVSVSGSFATVMLSSNPVYIGGIAGRIEVSDSKTAYIGYVQNCVSTVVTTMEKFDDDGESSCLDAAAHGGIIGSAYTYNGALAILNCVSNGSVEGGQYAGGIVGYVSGSCISIVDCANYAKVKGTNKEVSYAGGIAGVVTGNSTIMDCVSTGRVTATKATSNTYKSYAGGIVGNSAKDDYTSYYSAGTAVVNCYYSSALSTYDVKNDAGENVATGTFTADWLGEKVNWDMTSWSIGDDGKAIPGKRLATEGEYTLSFFKGETLVKSEKRAYDADKFSIVGVLDEGQNEGSNLFFDWEFEGGVRYRYYVPVIKDMKVSACYGDVSEIAHVYTGKGDYHGEVDGGVLYLAADGSLKRVSGTAVSGKYTYNGDGILMLSFYDNIGDITATVESDGSIKMTIDYGMSGEVEYTYTKSDLKLFGEYYNADGDMLTFSNGKVVYQSESVTGGATLSGTYTMDGDDITIDATSYEKYFTKMSATINDDMSLTVNFVGKGSVSGYDNVKFDQPSANYEGQDFVGTYYTVYASLTDNDTVVYEQTYTIEFRANGVVSYQSYFSETLGTYCMFKNNTVARVSLEGKNGTLYFDKELGIFYGDLHRTSSKRTQIFLPAADGAIQTILIGDINHAIYVNGKGAYYVKDGAVDTSATIVAPNDFADQDRVTIDGVAYRVLFTKYSSAGEAYKSAYLMQKIGAEEGMYTYDGKTFELDGIGNVVGAEQSFSSYMVYDKLVVVVFDDGSIVGFDYEQAKAADGAVTLVAQDGYGGIWYQSKTATVEDEDGEEVEQLIEKYYLLILDGYGHTRVLYWRVYDKSYNPNWGGSVNSGWVEYTKNATGVHAEYNDSQIVDFMFFYDGNLAYTKSSTWIMKETSFIKIGYTGTTEIPTLPTDKVGSYTGAEADGTAVVLNLKKDLTGSFKGVPFTAVYDGLKSVTFTIDGTLHTFDITTNVIAYGSENVTLTRSGDVTEVIPAALCGTWNGTWTLANGSKGNKMTLTIEADGTFVFGSSVSGIAEYDATKSQITMSCTKDDKPYVFTLTYDTDTKVFSGKYVTEYDGNNYTYECPSLTKDAE